MHLTEILEERSAPGRGVFLALTRRCPLSCAHCSTRSELSSEEHDAALYRRFVASFTAEDHPGVLFLTGGEPLLRPALVRELAEDAHSAGTRVVVISGMYFARQPSVPPAIEAAVGASDHLIASLDAFHDEEVPRADVLRTLRHLRDRGTDVSIQMVGLGPDDPYLGRAIDDVRRIFDDEVPMLVGEVGAAGRAATWLDPPTARGRRPVVAPDPCSMAAWPVVTFDGTVVACCNQDVVDGPRPAHLDVGHASTDGWPTIRERHARSTMLRGIRVFGPRYVAEHLSERSAGCSGQCATCITLSDEDRPALQALVDGPSFAITESTVVSMWRSAPLSGTVPQYAGLSRLGLGGPDPCPH